MDDDDVGVFGNTGALTSTPPSSERKFTSTSEPLKGDNRQKFQLFQGARYPFYSTFSAEGRPPEARRSIASGRSLGTCEMMCITFS